MNIFVGIIIVIVVAFIAFEIWDHADERDLQNQINNSRKTMLSKFKREIDEEYQSYRHITNPADKAKIDATFKEIYAYYQKHAAAAMSKRKEDREDRDYYLGKIESLLAQVEKTYK